jgi:hypothetical protein
VATVIKNQHQYRITKAQAEKFQRTIKEVQARPNPSVHTTLRKAQLDGLRSQLEDLKREIQEYEALREGAH